MREISASQIIELVEKLKTEDKYAMIKDINEINAFLIYSLSALV